MDSHLVELARRRQEEPGSVGVYEAHRRYQHRTGMDLGFDLPPAASYSVLPTAPTYAKGLKALRDACDLDRGDDPELYQPSVVINDRRLVRPLTFEEGVEALVRGDKELWGTWFLTSTSIHYQGGTGRFRIRQQDERLITLPEEFNQPYLPVAYTPSDDDLQIDDYNRELEEGEVMDDPLLKQLVPNNKLRREWKDLVYQEKDKEIYVWLSKCNQDQLRALALLTSIINCDVVGYKDLNSISPFSQVTQKKETP